MEGFEQISRADLEIAYKEAWSIESMEAHGAEGRELEYIGSQIGKEIGGGKGPAVLIFDYYRDSEGDYWYGRRAWTQDGKIMSMSMYLFGKETRRRTARGRKR